MRAALLGVILALILPACGDGASGPSGAAVLGVVYEVDGQTVDRSGVLVRMLESGDFEFTDSDGEFKFDGVPPGSYTLDFDIPFSEEEEQGEEPIEHEDDREDGEGRPIVEIHDDCTEVQIRVALENGAVREFTIDEHEGSHAKAPLWPFEDTEVDLEGVIKISSTEERELFKVEVAPLDEGTVIEILLDDREGDGPIQVGTAIADAGSLATFMRDTGEGQELPFGADFVAALSGHKLLVRLAESDELVLIGEVPDLPAEEEEHDCEEPGEGEGEEPGEEEPKEEEPKEEEPGNDEEGSKRGKDLLEAAIDGIEGHVEIRSWPREEIERFRMDIWGLEPGDQVRFEIEDPETDSWVLLGIRTVNDDGFAKVDTDGDLEMPLGVVTVADLVGLKVRIRRSEENNDDLLMEGVVPELVKD
jgi:hypothetical protein